MLALILSHYTFDSTGERFKSPIPVYVISIRFILISDHTIQTSLLEHSSLLLTVNSLEISLPSKLSQIRVNGGTLIGIIGDMTL